VRGNSGLPLQQPSGGGRCARMLQTLPALDE
jgi:hypothetical protein